MLRTNCQQEATACKQLGKYVGRQIHVEIESVESLINKANFVYFFRVHTNAVSKPNIYSVICGQSAVANLYPTLLNDSMPRTRPSQCVELYFAYLFSHSTLSFINYGLQWNIHYATND